MKLLLADNSNTRTKFAFASDGELADPFWIPTEALSEASISDALGDQTFDAAVLCSVVPATRVLLEDFLSERAPVHVLGPASPLGIGIDYPDPASIGADRLANAIGVAHRHRTPAVVIDFGTAVTFDVVSPAPAYCGGVIAPGLGAMGDYLSRRTALLPRVELEEPASAIGKSTAAAMQAGAVIGYRGLVREILGAIRAELEEAAVAVATGGDAALIARGVPEIEAVDPDLTLHGLRLLGQRVFG